MSAADGEQVLVTGANGFVGRAVCVAAARYGLRVRAAVRDGSSPGVPPGVARVAVGEIGAATEWRAALDRIGTVVHLAGRAHKLRDRDADPLAAFRAVNLAGTEALAWQAAEAGVRRLVFVSTIGVHGDTSGPTAIDEDAPLAPHSPYATSKLEAERALAAVAARTGLEVVVVRPPLVYDADAPGNFALLRRVLALGLPLPLGAVRNRRTLVERESLARLLVLAAVEPAAAGRTFVAGDAADVSTPELVRALAAGMGRRARLVPVPPAAVGAVARIAGRAATWRQLAGSLRVSSARAQAVLGWAAVSDPAAALEAVGRRWRAPAP